MNKALAIMVSASIAILAGCAQSVGSDGYDYDRFMKSGAHHDVSIVQDTEKPNICLVGDSRVYQFPNDLLASDYDVFNYGCGWTTTYWNNNLLGCLVDEGKHFDILIISVGVNDCNAGIPNDLSIESLRGCLESAALLADRVYITSIPGCCVRGYMTANESERLTANATILNRYITILATESGATYIPVHAALANESGTYIDIKYDDGTGLHYNAAGYAVIYDLYMQYLR